MSKCPVFALIAVVLLLGVSACGSSSSSSTSGVASKSASTPASTTASGAATATPSIGADPSGQLKFDKSSLSAKAGKVTITFTNDASIAHNLTIQQGTNGPVVGATPTFQGGAKKLTVNLKPGTYTFYCSVPGHRQAGMQGTLIVH